MELKGLFVTGVLLAMGLLSCSDGDSHDGDDELDMSGVLNKDLYYNPWLNNKDVYTTQGMVEVIRFSGDGKLWGIDFGGKTESLLGTWKAKEEENVLNIEYETKGQETWHVLDWEKGKFTVMVNDWKREYVTAENKDSEYLQGLTGDAFLLTEIDQRESKTMLRVMLEGDKVPNVISAQVVLSDDQIVELKADANKAMIEKETIDASLLGLPGAERDVVFYVNEGKGKEFKFADHVYVDGLGKKDFSAFDLHSRNTGNEMTITWKNPYVTNDAYYQIEVMSVDEKKMYFVSDYLPKGTLLKKVDNTTTCMAGYTNDMRELFGSAPGSVSIKVRLSIILLEPGIDIDSECSYMNRQSVTKVTSIEAWN